MAQESARGRRGVLGIQISFPEMLVCVTHKHLQFLCVEWNFKITLKQRISKLVIGFCICLFVFLLLVASLMKFCFLVLIVVRETQIRFSSYNDFGDAKEQGDSKCFRKAKTTGTLEIP